MEQIPKDDVPLDRIFTTTGDPHLVMVTCGGDYDASYAGGDGRYEDNVAIAVVVFGPGIHLLARQPRRPVPPELRQRAQSQARDYGVRFVACGNTMTTLGWTAADMADFVKVEQVGASVLMELQEQGWAYIAW